MFIYSYFTSSDPHHDMLGGGCQVRVVIENMMGKNGEFENIDFSLELLRQAAASIGLMSAWSGQV